MDFNINDLDITKTGNLTYKDLQNLNKLELNTPDEDLKNFLKENSIENATFSQTDPTFTQEEKISSSLNRDGDYFGKSMWDNTDEALTETDINSNLSDKRAKNQWAVAKAGAGVLKAVTMAGTTFVDGTVGLLYGGTRALANIVDDSSDARQGFVGGLSYLWDNEISNGLQEVNQTMEQLAPNYRTEEELNNKWYQNMGTMNFWADDIVKNAGFTIGAFFSGNAWTKALKAANLVKGGMGARITGSFLSAINEGRIEANNACSEFGKEEYSELDNKYKEILKNIDEQPDAFIDIEMPDGSIQTINVKEQSKLQLQENYNKEKQELDNRIAQMGAGILAGNTVFLSLNNFATLGKLYSRGFKGAVEGSLKNRLNKAGDQILKEEANEVGNNIVKINGKYAFDKITRKKALAKGLTNGILEGHEEMAQALISETMGNYISYDSPDAYYLALTNPTAERNTNEFLKSVTQGFADTYMNIDRYNEAFAGFIIGMFGTPTFGKLNNSEAHTYLGKGRSIGMSGGFFGELSNAKEINKQGEEAVQVMNQYLDKLQQQKKHFVQSTAFTDVMNGFAEANNAFEYKNAEDNEDFAALARFHKMGKLDDFKNLINQDFENMSDEELEKIAHTNKNNNPDIFDNEGNLTDSGKTKLKKQLVEKRDKMLKEVENFADAQESIRGIANGSLNEDQMNELAWLKWKLSRFDERYSNIKEENKNFLNQLADGLANLKEDFDESEKGLTYKKNIENLENYISYLRKSKTSLDLASRLASNKHINDMLQDENFFLYIQDKVGMSYNTFKDTLDILQDAAKISTAAKTFNIRLAKFTKNPLELQKNRDNLDKKNENINKAATEISNYEKINNANVSDIVTSVQNGEINFDELDAMIPEGFDEAIENSLNTESQSNQEPNGKQKIEIAKQMFETQSAINKTIDDSNASDTNKKIAKALINHSMSKSQSVEQAFDTSSEAFNAPKLEELGLDLSGMTPEEIEQEFLEARSNINLAKEEIDKLKEAAVEITDPNFDQNIVVVGTFGKDGKFVEVGHDPVEQTISENERKEKQEKSQEEQQKKEQKNIIKNDLISDIKNQIGIIDNTFDKQIKFILDIIDNNKQLPNDSIKQIIGQSEAYKKIVSILSTQKKSIFDNCINSYITQSDNVFNTAVPSKNFINSDTDFVNITQNDLNEETNIDPTLVSDADNNVPKDTNGIYKFLKPTTSLLPNHIQKGDDTPFYKIAEQQGKYSHSLIKRMEAIWNYINDKNGFKYIDNNQVKPEDTIYFTIDPTLNTNAGVTDNNTDYVILMTTEDGIVIGDLPSILLDKQTAYKQQGLPELIQKIQAEYTEFKKNNPNDIFKSKYTTSVSKNMIGKVPYTKFETNWLIDIATPLDSDTKPNINGRNLLFGISTSSNITGKNNILATAGNTKKEGKSELEKLIISPLKAKAGQPFMLLETSRRANNNKLKYVCVPIITANYGTVEDSSISKLVDSLIDSIPNVSNIMTVRDELNELLSLKGLYINTINDANGIPNLQFRIITRESFKQGKVQNTYPWIDVYQGPLTNDALNLIKSKLKTYGIPFQVNRKYFNKDDDTNFKGTGLKYNDLLGQVCYTNLPKNTTHTVSDWFTLNPIDSNGNEIGAKNPKSLKYNPNSSSNVQSQEENTQSNQSIQSQQIQNDQNNLPQTPLELITSFKGFPKEVIAVDNSTPNGVPDVYFEGKTNRGRISWKKNAFKIYKYDKNKNAYYGIDLEVNDDYKEQILNAVLPNEFRQFFESGEYKKYIKEIKNKDGVLVPDHSELNQYLIDKYNIYPWNHSYVNADKLLNSEGLPIGNNDFSNNQLGNFYVSQNQTQNNNSSTLSDNTQPIDIQQDVVNQFAAYFEGGGSSMMDHYPNLTQDMFMKLGNFIMDPANNEFTQEDARQLLEQTKVFAYPQSQKLEQTQLKEKTLDEKFKDKGLATKYNDIWNKLSDEQKSDLINKSKIQLRNELDKIAKKGPRYKKGNKNQITEKIDINKEVKWLSKVLPQLNTKDRLRIVEGIEKIAGPDNTIYGIFQNGAITVATGNESARGTLYHEAFHAVANTLLTQKEFDDLIKLAKIKYKEETDFDAEEALAENFRQYVQDEEGFTGKIVKFFRTLKHICQSLLGKEPYINNLFYRINRGKLANWNLRKNNSEQNYYRKIEQKQSEQYNFFNLDDNKINHLNERGISKEQYEQMSDLQKEQEFKCNF